MVHKRITLYHVTREQVAYGITNLGIRPQMATGKLQAAWYVDADNIFWAMAHVSQRWGLPTDQLIVAEVHASEILFKRWTMPGVYYSKTTIFVKNLWGYERFLKPEV